MRIVGPLKLEDVVAEWGRHEAIGRFSVEPGFKDEIEPHLKKLESRSEDWYSIALFVAAEWRKPLLEPIVAASVTEVVEVELSADDLPSLGFLNHVNLDRVIRDHADDEGIKKLASSDGPMSGLAVLVARGAAGPWRIYDGIHRTMAWHRQVGRGLVHPLRAAVIVTKNATSFEEMAPPE